MKKSIQDKVLQALNEIRPFLQSDGGDIELVSIQDSVVKVKLIGACSSCAINQSTMKAGVEMTVKKYAPEILEVVNID